MNEDRVRQIVRDELAKLSETNFPLTAPLPWIGRFVRSAIRYPRTNDRSQYTPRRPRP